MTSLEENRRIITEVFAQLGRLAQALNPTARVMVELDADTYNALSMAQGYDYSPGTAADHSVANICGVAVMPRSVVSGPSSAVTGSEPRTKTILEFAMLVVANTKHGPRGMGGDGPCDATCAKCEAESVIERERIASPTAPPPP